MVSLRVSRKSAPVQEVTEVQDVKPARKRGAAQTAPAPEVQTAPAPARKRGAAQTAPAPVKVVQSGKVRAAKTAPAPAPEVKAGRTRKTAPAPAPAPAPEVVKIERAPAFSGKVGKGGVISTPYDPSAKDSVQWGRVAGVWNEYALHYTVFSRGGAKAGELKYPQGKAYGSVSFPGPLSAKAYAEAVIQANGGAAKMAERKFRFSLYRNHTLVGQWADGGWATDPVQTLTRKTAPAPTPAPAPAKSRGAKPAPTPAPAPAKPAPKRAPKTAPAPTPAPAPAPTRKRGSK